MGALVRPDAKLSEVTQEVLVDDLELSTENPPGVDVAGVSLHRLVVSKDLRSACSGHGGQKEAVTDPVLRYLGFNCCPVMEITRSHPPHVVLELPLRHGAALVGGVRSFLLCNFARSFQSSIINSLEYLLVQGGGFFRFEWKPHEDVSIRQTLDTNTNRPVPHVAVPRLNDGVIVHINDLIQVLRGYLGHALQPLEVVSLVRFDKHVDSNGCQVTDCNLIRCRVLHNLSAQVGALDGAKVLLVTLPVTSVLVEHVRSSCFDLALNNRIPQLLSFHGLPCFTFTLVLLIKSLELFSPDLVQTRALVRTQQGPVTISLHPLHEEVRNPHSIEQVPSTLLLLPVVLTQVKEIKDIRMPRLEIDGEGQCTPGGNLEETTYSVNRWEDCAIFC